MMGELVVAARPMTPSTKILRHATKRDTANRRVGSIRPFNHLATARLASSSIKL
jgi:hypothetical protein